MSDMGHGSTKNISALVNEIIAARPHRSKPNTGRRLKYRGAKYKGHVRLLSVLELAEFRAHVDRCMEARS